MIVPKDARALLHYPRCARPRHLRVLRRERAGDADRSDDCAVEDDGEAALGVMSLTASRRSPAPPAAITSSSALLGRLNRSAVLALPSETPIEAS